MTTALRDGETIVFIGDSITDCGRREDAGPLGRGYVKLFADFLLIRDPRRQVTIHNRGINGDRVNSGLAHIPQSGLTNRWQRDVLDLKPDWLAVMVGINDITSNLTPGVTPVTPHGYEETYGRLLSETQRALPCCRLLLLEPFFLYREDVVIEDPRHRAIVDLLPKYLAAVHRLAVTHGARLVRTQQMFRELIALHGTEPFGSDSVHPNLTGHLAIAEAVYNALR